MEPSAPGKVPDRATFPSSVGRVPGCPIRSRTFRVTVERAPMKIPQRLRHPLNVLEEVRIHLASLEQIMGEAPGDPLGILQPEVAGPDYLRGASVMLVDELVQLEGGDLPVPPLVEAKEQSREVVTEFALVRELGQATKFRSLLLVHARALANTDSGRIDIDNLGLARRDRGRLAGLVQPSIWKTIARRISRRASSRVSPAAMQPGMSGTCAPQVPSPRSTTTRYFIRTSLRPIVGRDADDLD